MASHTTDLENAGKVGRVIADRDLTGVPAELAARWTGESDERYSLRALADYFNERVVAAAIADTGLDALSGDAEHVYRVLTGEEGSAGDRTDLRNRLDRAGVDPDRLEKDFVSHQTVYTFLTDHLDVSYDADERSQIVKDTDRINRLESRLAAVADDVVERSDTTGRITVGETDVFVETQVLCADCGANYTVQDLLDRGGCDCGE